MGLGISSDKNSSAFLPELQFSPRTPRTWVPESREEPVLFNHVKLKLQQLLRSETSEVLPGPPSIFRIPGGIVEKAYQPMAIPVGLYHHNWHPINGNYILHDEKLKCLQNILSRLEDARASKLLDECLRWLAEPTVHALVKEYYSEKIHLTPHELAEILLVDACFIIEDLRGHKIRYTEVSKVKWCDLLKLENQIPFFVIQTLYDHLKMPDDPELIIPIVNVFCDIGPLLEFSLIDLNKWKAKDKKEITRIFPNSERELGTRIMCYHLLHLFHSYLVRDVRSLSPMEMHPVVPGSIPSATELNRAWIKISKKVDATSFLDVTYKDGEISLPELRVHNLTYSFLRDLIQFEQRYNIGYPRHKKIITLFIVLMRCILKTPKDVKLLVSKGILIHELTTDEAVVELFDSLCKDTQYRVRGSYVHNLFYYVNTDYESQLRKSWVTLRSGYLSNRWAFCSILAAVVLLIFSFLQVFYAMYSYYHPRQ